MPNNGTITATGSGGTGAYEYKLDSGSWQSSNVFSSLTAGTYTVYIKDVNSCETNISAVVGNSIVITNPSKFN